MILIEETCCHENCHVTWGMTKGMHSELQKNGRMFYCPNGHGQHYTNSDAEKLRRAQSEVYQKNAEVLRLQGEVNLLQKKCKRKKKK